MSRFYQLLKIQVLDYLRILLIGLGSYLGVINVLNFIDRSEGFSFTININILFIIPQSFMVDILFYFPLILMHFLN